MKQPKPRRAFLKKSIQATIATSSLLVPTLACSAQTTLAADNESVNFIGPKKGYSPQVGTLVSMMTWMRKTILSPVRDLSVKELDYLQDENANSIGAMLWHLAATERFYQLNTFDGKSWGDWPEKDDKEFSIAMSLGDAGRSRLKGHDLAFYLEKLERVRAYSLQELAKRDDEWLLKVDTNWMWTYPTNNYCKWFHVVEHESNHNGQIKFIKSRIS